MQVALFSMGVILHVLAVGVMERMKVANSFAEQSCAMKTPKSSGVLPIRFLAFRCKAMIMRLGVMILQDASSSELLSCCLTDVTSVR